MAKAYKVGKILLYNDDIASEITGVSGKPSDYRVYACIDNGVGFTMSQITLSKVTSSKWKITYINPLANVNGATLYWALVKKVNPSVGKAIIKTGEGVIGFPNSSLVVSNSCKDCRLLANPTGLVSCSGNKSSTGFKIKNVSSVNSNLSAKWIIMKKSNFLRDIKLL